MQIDYEHRNQYTGPRPLVERFWEKVELARADECWPWLAGTNQAGYGQISRGRGRGPDRAHRVAYALAHNVELDPGTVIMHHCDNPICCNPHHLQLAARATNNRDMFAKGRHNKKLEPAQVVEIRAQLATRTNHEIAADYGVTHSMISKIRTGAYWNSVPD